MQSILHFSITPLPQRSKFESLRLFFYARRSALRGFARREGKREHGRLRCRERRFSCVLRRASAKDFLPRRAPIRKRRLVSCPDFLRMSSDADGSRRRRVGTAFLAAAGNGGGHLTLCAVLRHSCLGFSSSARLRPREHCAFLRAAAPRREDVWGAAPYPARELSSLDLPLFQPLRKKETAPFCSRRVPVLPRSSGVFNSSCISFAVISGPPCFAAQSFHTFSPQPSFQREQ